MTAPPKPLVWVASSKKDLKTFPRPVQRDLGQALELAQFGLKPLHAKPWRGFRGASVLEVAEDHAGNTYRAVYTVRFPGRIYVLHAFHKKSTRGIETPRHEIDLVKARLRDAARIQAELAAQ